MKKLPPVGTTLIFEFDEGLASIVFDVAKVSATVRERAMFHGFSARIGDNAAIARKQKDGSVIVVTEEMRRDAVLELVTHYESGAENWDVKRGPVENPMIRAWAVKLGGTYAQAEQHLKELLLKDL